MLLDWTDGRVQLVWDPDGTGSGAAVPIVDFATQPALTATDILII